MSVIMSRECVESYSLPLQASDTDEISSLSDRPRVISVTSHSGLIRNLMPSLNHDVVTLGTAGLLPMLLRADCEEVHSPAVVSTNAIEKADDETKRVFLIWVLLKARISAAPICPRNLHETCRGSLYIHMPTLTQPCRNVDSLTKEEPTLQRKFEIEQDSCCSCSIQQRLHARRILIMQQRLNLSFMLNLKLLRFTKSNGHDCDWSAAAEITTQDRCLPTAVVDIHPLLDFCAVVAKSSSAFSTLPFRYFSAYHSSATLIFDSYLQRLCLASHWTSWTCI